MCEDITERKRTDIVRRVHTQMAEHVTAARELQGHTVGVQSQSNRSAEGGADGGTESSRRVE
jgi:hypothetical protein